jgi:polysaccharide pyruvyl transferase WcaK-like protein
MEMQILIDGSSHKLYNAGDIAMLQIAVRRIRGLWPAASIKVMTAAPEVLRHVCPTVEPVPAEGQQQWFQTSSLLGMRHAHRSSLLRRAADAASDRTRDRLPGVSELLLRARLRRANKSDLALTEFLQALEEADLVVVSGGGFVTDAFAAHAVRVLSTLGTAARRGIPTAMFSQGIGPISDPALRAAVLKTFPRLDLLSLRERVNGPALARSLGARADCVITTGDDAIELAWERRKPQLGYALGLNLRSASYSGMDSGTFAELGPVLHRALASLNAPILPVPISNHAERSDLASVDQVLEGYRGEIEREAFTFSTGAVIDRVSRCRIIVTASYHSAVFALAQGIPAVCLVASSYYHNKFAGLAEQFGSGCAIIATDDSAFAGKLRSAVKEAWNSAEGVRNLLRDAALRQIQSSDAGYRHFYDIVGRRRAA